MKNTFNFQKKILLTASICLILIGKAGVLHAISDPLLNEAEVEQLRSLPYGVSNAASLIVRSRHIDKVKFSGAGSSSKYGFIQERGIIKEGLWLRFRNIGPEQWSSCILQFEPNVDVSKYNSIVLWVRALERRQRILFSVQDRGWTKRNEVQGKSPLFPVYGLPRQKILQVVVPFKSLIYKGSMDFSRLDRLEFYFGRQTIGNGEGDVIEILGLAFVEQPYVPSKILFINPYTAPSRPIAGSSKASEPFRTKSHPPPPTTPVPISTPTPLPVKKVLIPPSLELTPIKGTTIKMELPPPVQTTRYVSSPELKEITEVFDPVKVSTAPTQFRPPSHVRRPFNPFKNLPEGRYLAISVLILLGGGLLIIRLKKGKSSSALGPVFHKLSWPLLADGLSNTARAEKNFWRKLSERKITSAWISPYQAYIARGPDEEHHGESFLRRQIKVARREGVHLIPSLCFVRTIFHFESFLANPQLYLTKAIPSSEIHLSDEELRVRYIGYFPVWIPPYWQKQQGLPQKLLLAYGKLPGIMATSDSVQFNLRSPTLRQMAIRVIEKFAQGGATGVRIEGAAALVNSSLNLYWGGAFNDQGLAQDREFWDEVIEAVKSKYPKFLFIADGSGPAVQKLREFGFDYFENDRLMEILFNQIRREEVGPLESLLSPNQSDLLHRSIYNVSPLFRSLASGPIPKQQGLLCGMVVGFLPGIIEHDGQIPQELGKFYSLVSKWSIFQRGNYVRLSTTSADILAFARWEKKAVYIVVVNFSLNRRSGSIRLDPFFNRLEDKKLYLFSDALHGATLLNDLKSEANESPAVAVLGQDLRESGLYLSLPELSLRLFSVNLGHPIKHENPSEVRQLHKT